MVVAGCLRSAAGSGGLWRSRWRSQAQMTPSRPPEYLLGRQSVASRYDEEAAGDSGAQDRVVGIDRETVDSQSMPAGGVRKRQDWRETSVCLCLLGECRLDGRTVAYTLPGLASHIGRLGTSQATTALRPACEDDGALYRWVECSAECQGRIRKTGLADDG